MKIATYRRIGIEQCQQYEVIFEMKDWMENSDNYVRITDYLEVEFKPLPASVLVGKQLAAIDQEEARIRNEFQSKLDELNNMRGELRALTHKE
jgi:hypothetical protein